MMEVYLLKELTISFIGASLAIISAGILWLIKSAYTKHINEIQALAKLERMLAQNITLLDDNLESIDKWIGAINTGRFFRNRFVDLITNEEETYKFSNLKLINQILLLNYMSKRANLDLDNLSSNYWKDIIKIDESVDQVLKENNLKLYNQSIKVTLEGIKDNYPLHRDEIIKTVAIIRVAANVRRHSLFGYINLIFFDICPRVTDVNIKSEIEKINKEIVFKKQSNNGLK